MITFVKINMDTQKCN